jgi:dTDP-glucose 4,6-dehydratase
LEKGEPGEIYNIGSGSHLSNNDLAAAILAIMGLEDNMKSYVSDRPGHDSRYSVDSSKVKALGFECEVDFKDGLSKTIDWYIASQDWWNMENEVKQ